MISAGEMTWESRSLLTFGLGSVVCRLTSFFILTYGTFYALSLSEKGSIEWATRSVGNHKAKAGDFPRAMLYNSTEKAALEPFFRLN